MGLNKDKVRGNAPTPGLITEVTSQLEAATPEAPPPDPPEAPTSNSNLTLSPSEPPREKCGWYIPPDVADDIRDAVDALKTRGLRIDGNVVDAGRLMESAIRARLQELYDAQNEGKRFPVSPGTRAIRAKRKR